MMANFKSFKWASYVKMNSFKIKRLQFAELASIFDFSFGETPEMGRNVQFSRQILLAPLGKSL